MVDEFGYIIVVMIGVGFGMFVWFVYSDSFMV